MKTWHVIVGIVVLLCLAVWYRWWNNRRKYETGYTIPVIRNEQRFDNRQTWADWLNTWFFPIAFVIGAIIIFWLTRKNR